MTGEGEDRLFDPGPARERPVEPPMSATRRLTERNRDMLRDGIHPATLKKLLPVEEDGKPETCGSCKHAAKVGNPDGNRHYWKCAKHRLGMSRSTASDVRRSWPACSLWEPRP